MGEERRGDEKYWVQLGATALGLRPRRSVAWNCCCSPGVAVASSPVAELRRLLLFVEESADCCCSSRSRCCSPGVAVAASPVAELRQPPPSSAAAASPKADFCCQTSNAAAVGRPANSRVFAVSSSSPSSEAGESSIIASSRSSLGSGEVAPAQLDDLRLLFIGPRRRHLVPVPGLMKSGEYQGGGGRIYTRSHLELGRAPNEELLPVLLETLSVE
ncbi:uncharacterized protein LOC131007149 [Salvia miltiorrhiza]|uniref:uncharacterized protein LOC131007149 n=1 Tax=Salvia miltiorrhiza TaxID=226208 RepID=UPI0025ABAE75|nr:uncharacterized protein LOC131007149 [Salvia miltiorrhiza]